MERRSTLEESRLLWQLYWNMAEEEAGSGGRLRRDGQVGCGEEDHARGERAGLAVILEHGRGGGRLWRAPTHPTREEVESIQEEVVELSEESPPPWV